jgi:hypothetical protein
MKPAILVSGAVQGEYIKRLAGIVRPRRLPSTL